MSKKLFDKAQFWVGMGAALGTVGGIGIAIGTVGLAPYEPLKEPWFILGVVLASVGVLCLACATVLFLAHRHLEHHLASFPPGDQVAASPEPDQEASEAKQLITATRLLSGELEEAQDKLQVALNSQEWWSLDYRLPTKVWEEYNTRLASWDGPVHKAVRDTYRKLGELNRIQKRRREASYHTRQSPHLSPDERTLVGLAFSLVLNAKEHLERLEERAAS